MAYNAEPALAPVLCRLPAAVPSHCDYRVLVTDDAAHNGTFELGLRYRRSHADLLLSVPHNRSIQGCEGNQKMRYTHAVYEGLDLVAFVERAGQHALLGSSLSTDQASIRSSPSPFSYEVFVGAKATSKVAYATLSTRTRVGAAA